VEEDHAGCRAPRNLDRAMNHTPQPSAGAIAKLRHEFYDQIRNPFLREISGSEHVFTISRVAI